MLDSDIKHLILKHGTLKTFDWGLQLEGDSSIFQTSHFVAFVFILLAFFVSFCFILFGVPVRFLLLKKYLYYQEHEKISTGWQKKYTVFI